MENRRSVLKWTKIPARLWEEPSWAVIAGSRNKPLAPTFGPRAQPDAEAFNAFNHANFGDPAATIGNSNAGVISSSAAPRVMQMALKLRF
jgi:hypothetical protein